MYDKIRDTGTRADGMPIDFGKSPCCGDLHYTWPRIAATTLLASFCVSSFFFAHDDDALELAPWYARGALVTFGFFHVMAVLPHVFLDDAGFESIARVDMGMMSVPYRVAIAYCKMEAIEKIFAAIIMWIVAAKLPQLACGLLGLLLCKQVCVTLIIWKWPLRLPDGTNCVPEAPAAKYEAIPRYVILVLPLAVAIANGYKIM